MEPLFVHEMITIHNGIHSREPYMEHQLELGRRSTTYDLFGTWKVVGMTGVWPRVLNIWHPRRGWEGFGDLLTETYGEVHANMHGFLSTMDQYRAGGEDCLVTARPGFPDDESAIETDPHALFIHENVTVASGQVGAYLDAVVDDYQPAANAVGRRLVAAFEGVLSDTQAILLWATTPEAYVASRGGTDDGLREWRRRARDFATGWREQLMVGPAGLRGQRDPF